jgi:hypothetical protein
MLMRSTISGDDGEGDPPVPIPNTEVKPFSADSTWLETTWEGRTLPDFFQEKRLKPKAKNVLYMQQNAATF